jgi:hypothetical protein
MNKLTIAVIIAVVVGYFVGVKFPAIGTKALGKVGI